MLGLAKASLSEVLMAVADVRLNVGRPDRFETIEATDGSTPLLLRSTDGRSIGSSGPFSLQHELRDALRDIQRVAPLAEIRIQTKDTATF